MIRVCIPLAFTPTPTPAAAGGVPPLAFIDSKSISEGRKWVRWGEGELPAGPDASLSGEGSTGGDADRSKRDRETRSRAGWSTH